MQSLLFGLSCTEAGNLTCKFPQVIQQHKYGAWAIFLFCKSYETE